MTDLGKTIAAVAVCMIALAAADNQTELFGYVNTCIIRDEE